MLLDQVSAADIDITALAKMEAEITEETDPKDRHIQELNRMIEGS